MKRYFELGRGRERINEGLETFDISPRDEIASFQVSPRKILDATREDDEKVRGVVDEFFKRPAGVFVCLYRKATFGIVQPIELQQSRSFCRLFGVNI